MTMTRTKALRRYIALLTESVGASADTRRGIALEIAGISVQLKADAGEDTANATWREALSLASERLDVPERQLAAVLDEAGG